MGLPEIFHEKLFFFFFLRNGKVASLKKELFL